VRRGNQAIEGEEQRPGGRKSIAGRCFAYQCRKFFCSHAELWAERHDPAAPVVPAGHHTNKWRVRKQGVEMRVVSWRCTYNRQEIQGLKSPRHCQHRNKVRAVGVRQGQFQVGRDRSFTLEGEQHSGGQFVWTGSA
jgi:hypothetical protein